MAPSYLVCATERSGSTLLCELLAGTGVAGKPEEYFEFLSATGRVRQPREYFPDDADPEILELLPPLESPLPDVPWARRLADARERGTTPNGVFGAKMMWAYLPDFLAHGEPEEQLGPLEIVYEEFAEAPAATICRVLEHVGVPSEGVEVPEPPMRRQSDHRSQEWVDRFREEVPA